MLKFFHDRINTGINRIMTPVIVIIEVAAAEPKSLESPCKSLKMIHERDVAFAEAEKPTIGSKTRKLSINCIKVINIIRGTM
tara:strand:+ start:569 stop:814 length:246 start_codon:yes stop_codon:yes gene_type:complete